MQGRPDIIVRGRDGRILAVVEFKAWRDMPHESALYFYSAFESDQAFEHVPYFLVITPLRVYFWNRSEKQGQQEPEIQPAPRFLVERTQDPIDHHVLMYATFEWLLRLSSHGADRTEPAETMLDRGGLVTALKDARMAFEPAA